MLKLSKPFVGFFLAVLIAFQGLLSPYFLKNDAFYRIAGSEVTTVDVVDNQLSADYLLLKNGLKSLSHASNIDPGFEEHFTFIIPHFLFQIEQEIKGQISRGLAIIIKFGLRESLFPSHYFW